MFEVRPVQFVYSIHDFGLNVEIKVLNTLYNLLFQIHLNEIY